MGAPHRPKINHGYGPGGKTVQLAISTATILKEGVVGMENNNAVNSKSVERAGERAFVLFCFCLFVCLFCLFFGFVFVFVFVFVVFVFFCFVFLNHLAQALNWYISKRTTMVNKMKNESLLNC